MSHSDNHYVLLITIKIQVSLEDLFTDAIEKFWCGEQIFNQAMSTCIVVQNV